MFRMPESDDSKRVLQRRMMNMVGIDDDDWIDDKDVLQKVKAKSRRVAIAPFAQDERFAETRKPIRYHIFMRNRGFM